MRILHTSDWHLNDRLGHIKRQDDIAQRLEEIAGYLDEHQVDVMVVAGDLLSQYNRIEEIKTAIGKMNELFKPFLLKGGTIVTISGNHDKEEFFRLLRSASDLASPIDPKKSDVRPNGRLYFVADPTRLLLSDKQGKQVQFVLMPYPTSARYLKNEKTRYGSVEEKNKILHQRMIATLNKFQTKYLDSTIPSVLVSHAHIRGSAPKKEDLYRITEQEDVILDPSEIPANWSYAAFGHIHRPQSLSGTERVRYSGSIERLDKGERNDDKSVVLFDVESQDDPALLPLDATPIYDITIADPETQIPALKEEYPEAEKALVSYKLIYKPSEHNRDRITREIEKIFPRWYKREIVAEGSDLSLSSHSLVADIENVSEVVRNYLKEQLKGNSDREAILALAEELLANDN